MSNIIEEVMKERGYLSTFNNIEFCLEKLFTKPLVMCSNNTYQFEDYSKYKAERFSEEEKFTHRKTQFPLDCQKAYEIGINLLK